MDFTNDLSGNKALWSSIDNQVNFANTQAILNEINWLTGILSRRLGDIILASDSSGKSVDETSYQFDSEMPVLANNPDSYYAQLVKEQRLNAAERLLLVSSLVPHISPRTFSDPLRDERSSFKLKYPVLGGYYDPTFSNFIPSLQTVLYLLGGDNLAATLAFHLFFTEKSKLLSEQIITFQNHNGNGDSNQRNYVLSLAPEFVTYLISGKKPRPDFGRNFPATLISTNLDWENLVVPESTRRELMRISKWSLSGKSLVEKTGSRLNGSFTCLFYGPSGGGKTLAVQLLGKSLGIDVFRIDLSMVVSKYIGETEKNLSYLFDRAKNKNWILFFDEADSLFGKRTEIHDSKDKWANLEMSYLLQRMEEHNGLTVLATNLKNNLDAALSRRFQSVIYFNKPDKEQRLELWQKLMPAPFNYDTDISFERLAKYELTGGNIINIIKAACLEAESKQTYKVENEDIAEAIKREFSKENRFPN